LIGSGRTETESKLTVDENRGGKVSLLKDVGGGSRGKRGARGGKGTFAPGETNDSEKLPAEGGKLGKKALSRSARVKL